jgi:DnaJ homolog subfamily A member 2
MPVETKLYDLLEISPSASVDEIKKAYRKKSLIHHPDKGGDVEVYKQINSAYQILSDPQKREMYDMGGENGLRDSGGIPEDMLSAMFGNIFAGGLGGGLRGGLGNLFKMYNKSAIAVHVHKVTLEDLCTRKVVKLKLTRDRVCSNMDESKAEICKSCNGRGVIVQRLQIAPGMVQQIQQPCFKCKNRGKIYPSCDQCVDGIIQDPKVFELHLTPELENGYKYAFQGEGNQEIGKQPGDFVVILQYEEHPLFKTEGKDIVYTHTLTLKEALCGHKLDLTHPSGEIITISTSDVTTSETIEKIPNKGLSYQSNLIIKYRVKFPEKLTLEQFEILSKIL